MFLAVVVATDPGVAGGGDWTAGQTLGMLVGSMVLVWSFAHWSSMRVRRRLTVLTLSSKGMGRLPGRVDMVMRTVVLSVFALQLTVGGWGRLVCETMGLERPGVILLGEVVLLLPFVVMELLRLGCFYQVNRYIREQVLMVHLHEGLAARPVWSRREYMSFNVRHGLLIILVPVLLILGFRDVVEFAVGRWFGEAAVVSVAVNGEADSGGAITANGAVVPDGAGEESGAVADGEVVAGVAEGVTMLGAAVIFIFSPLLLKRIWLTRRLAGGPLREKLEGFCRRIGLRYRDLLLWDTHSGVGNAAVMGLFRPVRYLLLSDALIENMPDEQIEAVFGHEAGHVRHHHIPFLVLFVMASGAVASLLMELVWRLVGATEGQARWVQESVGYAGWAAMPVVGLGWVLVFGWVSRRFERQADVHAAICLAKAADVDDAAAGDDSCSDEDVCKETEGRSSYGDRLDPYGAGVMAASLGRIALLNGISIHSRSWRHSSIASRMAFLGMLARENGALRRSVRLVRWVKVAIVFAFVVGVTGLWLVYRVSG